MDVSRADPAPIDNFAPPHPAHDAACQIIFIRRIETRHLRRFTADQSAAHGAARHSQPAHDFRDDFRMHFPCRQVVEEK